ncbi:sensor histidine kinase [Roseateles sp. LKC17W]|uniref:histidine kinase n=1 Tax=Pelomonas margarita TaxID=3299031 RepID=A0ABW7FI67_9BURK
MPSVKRAWTNSLSFKVILAYLAGSLLSVLIIVMVIKGLLSFKSPILVEEDIAEHAEHIADDVVFDASGRPVGLTSDLNHVAWMFETMKDDIAYRVVDSTGRVGLMSPAGKAFWPEGGGQVAPPRPGRFEFERDGKPYRGATEAIPDQGQQWFLQLAASARLSELLRLEFALPFMGIGMALFSAVLLFVFGVCAFVTMRHVQKPLRALSASAAAISPRSLHARLQGGGVPTEIAPLVDSFNRVLERVEQGFRVQQEFMATAAHELKTPLALIRAQIELLDPHCDRDSLLKDVEHMTRQVQQLLLLAEASEAHNYMLAPTDVLDVAHEAASYLQRMAQAANVSIEVRGSADTDTVEWNADCGAVFTLLKNLLENAIQHAPAGSVVSLDVSSQALSVRDRGPGVSPDQLPKLFVRFWRGAHRRDHGAGLGLAICQEIAQAHGWELSAQAMAPGLRLTVSRDGRPPS